MAFRAVTGLTIVCLLLAMGPPFGLAQTKGIWDDTLTKAKSGIWDDTFTRAKSGVEGNLMDPGNSDGKSGLKTPPQTFFIPPPRYFEDVDPDELDDTRKKDYSPYALARFTQTVTYQGKRLETGYYLVKLADRWGGSPKTNLHTLTPVATTQPGAPGMQPAIQSPPTTIPEPEGDDTRQTLVLKQLGKVIMVLPVHRKERYKPPKGQKRSRHAMAEVVMENHRPVLKYYFKKMVYMTDLTQPNPYPPYVQSNPTPAPAVNSSPQPF